MHRVPVGFADVEEVGGAEDAGVVDQHVDPAEGGERGGERGVDLAAAAATSQRMARASAARDRSRRSDWPAAGVDVPERDLRAAGREQPRASGADAVGRAGDDDDPAGEVEADVVHGFAAGAVEPDARCLAR